MKKILLGIGALTAFTTFSQNHERCATHQAIEHIESQNPGYKAHLEEEFQRAKQWSAENSDRMDEIKTIPVVVHIVYKNVNENLDNSVILDQIASLNEDYSRTNADTTNMRSDFQSIVGDTRIRFVLASEDPDGNPTNGITRTSTTVQSFIGVGGFPAEGVKSTANGGIDPWDQTRYMNIWVCDMAFGGTPALLGYATPPDELAHWPAGSTDGLADGVVIQFQSFGRTNPNPLQMQGQTLNVRGRTATHEVGHYLGLRHIWGDGDCNEQDGVDDTPNASDQSQFDCNPAKNTCVDNIGTLGDLPDMIENYMDYSAETCQNSFTKGQKDIMYGVLSNQRQDLVATDNPALGINNSISTIGLFEMYPNPSNGQVNFNTDLVNFSINIVSIDGKQVFSGKNIKNVDLSDLNKGLYLVNVVQNNQILKTEKLVLR